VSKKKVLLRGVFINRDTNGEGVLKVGTTLIRVSTVMGILYNVLFIMELVSDKDIWALEQWMNGINNIYMKDIHNWCRIHFVKYHTVFVYRKEYPVKANIWNGYSYIRWRMERLMNLG